MLREEWPISRSQCELESLTRRAEQVFLVLGMWQGRKQNRQPSRTVLIPLASGIVEVSRLKDPRDSHAACVEALGG